MTFDKSVFPQGCLFVYDNGRLRTSGVAILAEQQMNDFHGKGFEHPCYGCRADSCRSRQVKYHQEDRRYLSLPVSLARERLASSI